MLVLRKYRTNESEKIKDILIKEGIRDLVLEDIIYVVLDDDELVGVTKAKELENIWLLKYLVIDERKRGQDLGDGLLRAILNSLYNQGIQKVYCRENNPYFVKKGFILNDDNTLEINIQNFFSKCCNSCGEYNVL